MENLSQITTWRPKMIVMVGKTPMYVKSIDTDRNNSNDRSLVKRNDTVIYYNKSLVIELKKFPKAEHLGARRRD